MLCRYGYHVKDKPSTNSRSPGQNLSCPRKSAAAWACTWGHSASGTLIIDEEGEAHLKTGWPICYTSVDSVFQIAAHEEAFGLDRLLKLCRDLAPALHAMKVGRVIARPFVGGPGSFVRTSHRRDYAIAPPAPVPMLPTPKTWPP